MKHSPLKKALSLIVSLSLVTAFSLPTTALAVDSDVDVANNYASANPVKAVSDITIDGVDAPVPFAQLDDKAVVTAAEKETWEIPALWVDDNLQLSTTADDDASNLPALAFFLPDGLAIEGDSFTITLSDSVAKLFGGEDLIALYDSSNSITYILPASILSAFQEPVKDTFDAKAPGAGWLQTTPLPEPSPVADEGQKPRSALDIYCAKTARDALSDAELEYLIDLVINKLEPQAVELIKDSFPAFKEAADNNQIGKQIGLYIYYQKGDKDNVSEHESASGALAYVAADAFERDGKIAYGYVIGIDTEEFLERDGNGNPVKDEAGKFKIARSGEKAATFNNTVVHELFHAFMDDYNRTGMLGAKTVEDGLTPGGQFVDQAQKERFLTLHYPRWFIEGTASAVENVFQFRNGAFKMLRAIEGSDSQFQDTFTRNNLLYNYLNAKFEGKDLNFEIEYSDAGGNVDTNQSRYVTGYLASLYLAQLAAQKDPAIGSAMRADGSISNVELCLGLNSILKRMHNGETLDQVIADISSIDGDPALYADTADFTSKFIKGPQNADESYGGDAASMGFTLAFLNYMRSLEKQDNRQLLPNGSILFGFDQDYNLPLDPDKQASSDLLKIVESNVYVESTVPSSVALAGGGKSALPVTAISASASEDALPLAAKAGTAFEFEPCNPVEPETANAPASESEAVDTLADADVANEPSEPDVASANVADSALDEAA